MRGWPANPLAGHRHLALSEDGEITMAHPATAVPLGFSAMGQDTLWWGGCAWDSFAPHLLPDESPVLVATCPACDTPRAWRVDNREPPPGEPGRTLLGSQQATCGTTSAAHLREPANLLLRGLRDHLAGPDSASARLCDEPVDAVAARLRLVRRDGLNAAMSGVSRARPPTTSGLWGSQARSGGSRTDRRATPASEFLRNFQAARGGLGWVSAGRDVGAFSDF